MSQWTAWNWIAYGCLAISAFGTAFGTIFQKYPQMLSRMPAFFSSSLWSFVPAIFLVIATVIFVVNLFIPAPVVDKSELTLRTYGDGRWPTRISDTNIWRYFYLRNTFVAVNAQSGEKIERFAPNLFICFDKPTKVGTLEVNSPDMHLPKYEIKEFKERFAIIFFDDELPSGTLQFKTY
jgi:hypothetical protein